MLFGTLDNRLQIQVTLSPQDVSFLDGLLCNPEPKCRIWLKGKLQRTFAPNSEPTKLRMLVHNYCDHITLEAYPHENYATRYDIIINPAELELLKKGQSITLAPKMTPGYALTVRVQDETT